ncbi:hypothetical protein [Streptomyces sp. NPDC000405]|uniref:hypothetical protein n=1 Tax=Streptomyces sp. NPDC000405 TaxID=3161033 RepID=UPI00398CF9EE
MPADRTEIPVQGRYEAAAHGPHLVLDGGPLSGHDTFLTGILLLAEPYTAEIPVRILTLDDITVLSPTTDPAYPLPGAGKPWSGVLRLPHGWRTPSLPKDLARAAATAGVDLGQWDEALTRYALTFLGEARDPEVRAQRIHVILAAAGAGQ